MSNRTEEIEAKERLEAAEKLLEAMVIELEDRGSDKSERCIFCNNGHGRHAGDCLFYLARIITCGHADGDICRVGRETWYTYTFAGLVICSGWKAKDEL
jgi:hypothetical protein